MSAMWWGVIGTSAIAFALKYSGQSMPATYLSHPRMQKINNLIPIALLSALVGVQTFAEKTNLYIDHRAFGVGVALIAFSLKAPFPVAVICAAVSSALLYRFA